MHAGKVTGEGVVTPMQPSTANNYLGGEVIYPRYYNTINQKAVAEKLAALENGEAGLLTSSGMAAITSVFFALLKPGDHAIFDESLYGGTYHTVMNELERMGVEFTLVKLDAGSLSAHTRDNTKLVYFETPSNPLLKITDIRSVCDQAKSNNITVVLDNTFATPINQNPLDLGADIVIHSGTKYLGGHSDLICGAVVSNGDYIDAIRSTAATFGGNVNAHTASLLERSLKTLGLRVARQNENGQLVAEALRHHSAVARVYYPGLTDHPGHEIAAKQMSGFGGMLSFELNEGMDTRKFLLGLKLVQPTVSLGGVETIICEPVKTSHAKMTPEVREANGIGDTLIRLSVGIEDYSDIVEDLDQALKHA